MPYHTVFSIVRYTFHWEQYRIINRQYMRVYVPFTLRATPSGDQSYSPIFFLISIINDISYLS